MFSTDPIKDSKEDRTIVEDPTKVEGELPYGTDPPRNQNQCGSTVRCRSSQGRGRTAKRPRTLPGKTKEDRPFDVYPTNVRGGIAIRRRFTLENKRDRPFGADTTS